MFPMKIKTLVNLRNFSLHSKLVRRLLYLYILLGLAPILAFIVIPLLYHVRTSNTVTATILLVQLVMSSVVFVVVVLIGGLVTLYKLALPIQTLIKGARAIAEGELSYRVPLDTQSDDEIIELTKSFNIMAESVQKMRDGIESQRQTLEETLAIRENEFSTINSLAELTNYQMDLNSTLKQALQVVHNSLGQDFLALFIKNATEDFFCTAFVCAERHKAEMTVHCQRRLDLPLIEMAAKTCQVVKSSDIQWTDEHRELRQSYESLDIGKFVAVPIVRRDQVLGVLMLMRQRNNPIPEQKTALLQALVRHIGVLIENVQLKTELRALGILEERRRMSSELHDSVSQSLFTLNLTAEGLKEVLIGQNGNDTHLPILDMLIDQTRKIQMEIRTLINELRPVDLQEERLDAALKRHAESLRHSSQSYVSLSIHGDIDRLPLAIQRNINRIAQEALSNIARHAQAEQVQIDLTVSDNVVSIDIRDDGRGFDPQIIARKTSTSLGLVSMRERAEMMMGALMIRSEPGNGSNITATVPIDL